MLSERDTARDFYERYLQRCNEHRFEELREFVTDDVNGPAEGLTSYANGLREVITAFPDYRWELKHLLVDGHWLAARLVGTGTHTSVFGGVAPTGRTISTQELVIYRLSNGKIAECWGDLSSTVRDTLTQREAGTAPH